MRQPTAQAPHRVAHVRDTAGVKVGRNTSAVPLVSRRSMLALAIASALSTRAFRPCLPRSWASIGGHRLVKRPAPGRAQDRRRRLPFGGKRLSRQHRERDTVSSDGFHGCHRLRVIGRLRTRVRIFMVGEIVDDLEHRRPDLLALRVVERAAQHVVLSKLHSGQRNFIVIFGQGALLEKLLSLFHRLGSPASMR